MHQSILPQKFLENLRREHGYEALRIEGRIPPGIRGRFWQAGIGMLTIGSDQYEHLFEGDGAVSCVEIRDEKAFGAVRLIHSKELDAELTSGKRLYGFRTAGGRGAAPTLGHRKNTANTNIYPLQDRLFACVQGYPPVEINPQTLETLREETWQGTIDSLSAHPHRRALSDAIFNFAIRGKSCHLFAFESRSTARRIASIPIDSPRIVHDFVVTEKHVVFIMPPVEFIPAAMTRSDSTFQDMFRWDLSMGALLVVVPLDSPQKARSRLVESTIIWHFVNAFECGSEIVIDALTYPDADHFFALKPESLLVRAPAKLSSLRRARVSLESLDLKWEQVVGGHPKEFPTVARDDYGRNYTYGYLARHFSLPLDIANPAIERVDFRGSAINAFEFDPAEAPSEPVLVPTSDGAYLLSCVYDGRAHQSYVGLFDSKNLEAGPRAKLWFDQHLPYRFHGFWSSGS